MSGGNIIAYNKAKAEQEWLRWKEAEEQQLRKLGVDEETIQRLHDYDWEAFKRERLYRMRQADAEQGLANLSVLPSLFPIQDIKSLLDSIEDEQLFKVLSKAEPVTLKILLMKIQGCKSKEIADHLGMDEHAVNMRIYRLRKKLKTFC